MVSRHRLRLPHCPMHMHGTENRSNVNNGTHQVRPACILEEHSQILHLTLELSDCCREIRIPTDMGIYAAQDRIGSELAPLHGILDGGGRHLVAEFEFCVWMIDTQGPLQGSQTQMLAQRLHRFDKPISSHRGLVLVSAGPTNHHHVVDNRQSRRAVLFISGTFLSPLMPRISQAIDLETAGKLEVG